MPIPDGIVTRLCQRPRIGAEDVGDGVRLVLGAFGEAEHDSRSPQPAGVERAYPGVQTGGIGGTVQAADIQRLDEVVIRQRAISTLELRAGDEAVGYAREAQRAAVDLIVPGLQVGDAGSRRSTAS